MLNNPKLRKTYDDLHDDHVCSVMVFVDPANNIIHADPECTEPLDAATVIELFKKRLAVGSYKGREFIYATPVLLYIAESAGWAMVQFLANNSDGGSLTTLTAYSKEYVAE